MKRYRRGEKLNVKLLAIGVALALLIVASMVQSIELVSLRDRMNTELSGLKFSKVSIESSISTLQKNLESLPGMVGGC